MKINRMVAIEFAQRLSLNVGLKYPQYPYEIRLTVSEVNDSVITRASSLLDQGWIPICRARDNISQNLNPKSEL